MLQERETYAFDLEISTNYYVFTGVAGKIYVRFLFKDNVTAPNLHKM